MVTRTFRLECGGLSPLLLAATRRGEEWTADESAVEKAGTSSRTPKFGNVRTPTAQLDQAKSGPLTSQRFEKAGTSSRTPKSGNAQLLQNPATCSYSIRSRITSVLSKSPVSLRFSPWCIKGAPLSDSCFPRVCHRAA